MISAPPGSSLRSRPVCRRRTKTNLLSRPPCHGAAGPRSGPWSLYGRAGHAYRALMTVNGDRELADGRAIVLRPAGPGDVVAITRLYLELSAESFHRRFHAGQPAPALMAQFARLGSGTVCFVAVPPADPDRLAAEARY